MSLSSGNGGVPLEQLCCPTCRELFTDYNLYADPREVEVQALGITAYARRSEWYILCPNGHKWTVKTLFRSGNEPDSVLLGYYLGEV